MTDFEFTVEAGHVRAFARALGDPDHRWEHAREAPPTFVAAAEHARPGSRLRPSSGLPWRGSGGGPGESGGSGGALHAEQHYEYHRPVAPGDRLVVRDEGTRTWDKTRRDGSVLSFTERTTAYRSVDGAPVVTERRVTVEQRPGHDGDHNG